MIEQKEQKVKYAVMVLVDTIAPVKGVKTALKRQQIIENPPKDLLAAAEADGKVALRKIERRSKI